MQGTDSATPMASTLIFTLHYQLTGKTHIHQVPRCHASISMTQSDRLYSVVPRSAALPFRGFRKKSWNCRSGNCGKGSVRQSLLYKNRRKSTKGVLIHVCFVELMQMLCSAWLINNSRQGHRNLPCELSLIRMAKECSLFSFRKDS